MRTEKKTPHATRFSHFMAQIVACAAWTKNINADAGRQMIVAFLKDQPGATPELLTEVTDTYDRYLRRGVGSGAYISPMSARRICDLLGSAVPNIKWDRLAISPYLNRKDGERQNCHLSLRRDNRWFSSVVSINRREAAIQMLRGAGMQV